MTQRLGAALLVLAMLLGVCPAPVGATTYDGSGIDPAQFVDPDVEYRPGVRWWLSGGAIDADEMVREIELLYDNYYGRVEINPFGGQLRDEFGDTDPYDMYQTEEYYEALEAAVAKAEELGMTVDLNMGSGWNANDKQVELEDSLGNMAIGREHITVTAADVGKTQTLDSQDGIPPAQQSNNYSTRYTWDDDLVVLQSLTIAPILSEAGTVNAVIGDDINTRYVLDIDNAVFIDMTTENAPGTVQWTPEVEGDYAVVALYYVPAGTRPIDSVDAETGYVVDHLSYDRTLEYMDLFVGNTRLAEMTETYKDTIGSYFNDSYELWTDTFHNERVFEVAGDESVLDYDMTPYLATLYANRAMVYFYMPGTTYYTIGDDEGENADETARLRYDHNVLLNALFQEGMQGFQEGSAKYNGTYRQQAYNVPVDQIGSARYIDVPESEQESETKLKVAASGAHLYGRNLATAEQFTLGNVPSTLQLEKVQRGINIMAVSGINNFYYHGFNYRYYGDEATAAAGAYGEGGYSAMPTIGIGLNESNSLWPYYQELNHYAARANYLLQQGSPSADVALYMPTFDSSVPSTGAAVVLNTNGYAWDAINDDSILNARVGANGQIVVENYGTDVTDPDYYSIEYGAIIVQEDSMTVQVMEKLEALADDGGTIVFYDTVPSCARHGQQLGGGRPLRAWQ